jgi:hypothetical protein
VAPSGVGEIRHGASPVVEGSALGKTLIFHQEFSGRTRVILVPETLGF